MPNPRNGIRMALPKILEGMKACKITPNKLPIGPAQCLLKGNKGIKVSLTLPGMDDYLSKPVDINI